MKEIKAVKSKIHTILQCFFMVVAVLSASAHLSFSQDSLRYEVPSDSLKLVLNTDWIFDESRMCLEYSIHRYPTFGDKTRYRQLRHLRGASPTVENFEDY